MLGTLKHDLEKGQKINKRNEESWVEVLKGTEFDLTFKRSPIAKSTNYLPDIYSFPSVLYKKTLILLGVGTKLPGLPKDDHRT